MRRALILLAIATALSVIAQPAPLEAAKARTWMVPGDFATIQDAIDSPMVFDGDTVRVGPGNFFGALVSKSVHIVGKGRTTLDDGPLHPAGLTQGFRMLAGSDGATIEHLIFDVDLAIMNGDAVGGVVVSHNTFNNALQAISNWRGNDWTITQNEIRDLRTRNGGGIGILVADYSGGLVTGNVVTHNTISGTLHVDPTDGGGYSGTGIVLYADFRWGRSGADAIRNNRVTHNTVSLDSDTPAVVDVLAFELTDTSESGCDVIFDNSIGFNDFRGTAMQIALTPASLDTCNVLSRNLGNNRGHGVHPGLIFTPGS